MGDIEPILNNAADVLRHRSPLLDPAELELFVKSYADRKDAFLKAVRQHGSPLYLLEEDVVFDRVAQFRSAFERALDDVHIFYAIKTNNNPAVARAMVRAGAGLDVSSGLELQLALDSGAERIVFSGPGKTVPEMELALKHADRVTVLMDSFGELERLETAASAAGMKIRAGVRLTTDDRGLWRKFGIPLARLTEFFEVASRKNHVMLRGLQFHVSWNLNPDNHVQFVTRLGKALRGLDGRFRSLIEFVDIGGGYWPPQGEWLQPAGTVEGQVRKALGAEAGAVMIHHRLPATSIDTFAEKIGAAIKKNILQQTNCRIYTEPGRWLINDAMHILLTVVDRKADDIAITDAGTNAIGWERFETDYFPVINLSRLDTVERECMILGSLCTPHDVWGYSYFGEDVQPGDILLIPTQGAYTYSLRQQFIKPVPETVVWRSERAGGELMRD